MSVKHLKKTLHLSVHLRQSRQFGYSIRWRGVLHRTMALYLEFEGQPHGPPVPQPKRESYVEGVAEELLNGLFCHYEPPPDLEPLPPTSRYPPRSPAGTVGTTPTSLQRGILLTPKVITPRPNHGRSVKWIDSDKKDRSTANVGDTRTNKVLTGRNDTAKAATSNTARTIGNMNQPFVRSNPSDAVNSLNNRQGTVRPDNRRPSNNGNDARDERKGLRDQSSIVGGGERDEPPRRDPPGLEADILRNLRKKREPALSARERKLNMQQRKAQLNLSVLDVDHADSMSAPQGTLFDDEGYPISEVSDESSYFPNRLQKVRSNERKGLIRFRPPSKSIPGKDPPTNIHGESPRRQGATSKEVGPIGGTGQLNPSNQAARTNAPPRLETGPKVPSPPDDAAMKVVRSPSPDAYSSTLCGFGPPVALKGDQIGRASPFSMLDGCRPCEAILLEPNEMNANLEDETVTLAPSEGNSAGLVFDGQADEIWMAGQDGRKIKRKWQMRRPKTILGCGADSEHQLEPESLLTPTRKYMWSRGRSFDSTDLQEVPSWNVAENPSMQSNPSNDGSRPRSPARPTRGRSTRARSPSPASVGRNGSYDDYKTPLQRLRSLGRRLSRSPGRSRSPGLSQSPARSRGRSNSPGPNQVQAGRRGRSESPFGRRGRSESPATRRKAATRSEQDKSRARSKPLFVNTVTTPQSSVFSNLASSRFHSPATSRGAESQRSDGALVYGGGESNYDDERDPTLNNNYGRSRGAPPIRAGLPPKSPARVSHYGSQRYYDDEREAPETTRSGLFGRIMRRNKDSRGVQNESSWGVDSYTQDEYDH